MRQSDVIWTDLLALKMEERKHEPRNAAKKVRKQILSEPPERNTDLPISFNMCRTSEV